MGQREGGLSEVDLPNSEILPKSDPPAYPEALQRLGELDVFYRSIPWPELELFP